jgi:hypothetical protein
MGPANIRARASSPITYLNRVEAGVEGAEGVGLKPPGLGSGAKAGQPWLLTSRQSPRFAQMHVGSGSKFKATASTPLRFAGRIQSPALRFGFIPLAGVPSMSTILTIDENVNVFIMLGSGVLGNLYKGLESPLARMQVATRTRNAG